MESATSLIPESSSRSVEDRILIAKIMRHVADYIKAVKEFGPDFFKVPIDPNNTGTSKAKSKRQRKIERWKTLAFGKMAYYYLFTDNDNELGFLPVCQTLGFNAATFRNKLKGINKKEAVKLYGLFLRGETQVKHVQENGE